MIHNSALRKFEIHDKPNDSRNNGLGVKQSSLQVNWKSAARRLSMGFTTAVKEAKIKQLSKSGPISTCKFQGVLGLCS